MKKYCLTECFKRNMSKKWKSIIETAAIIGIIVAFVAAYMLFATGFGYILVEILNWLELGENDSYTGMGVAVSSLTAVATIVLYHVYNFAKVKAVQISSFAKKRYEGEPFECSIFEECKDD